MSEPTTFHEALERLTKARSDFDQAEAAERTASNRATDCRNRLNEAMKDFDTAVALVRETAPIGTRWKAHTGRQQGV